MSTQLIHDFAAAISAHDIEKICSLMAEDHTFIDAHGNEVVGKEKMKVGWSGYFQWFPDYKIEVHEVFTNGDCIAAFGFASGTYKGLTTENNENYWRLPASWKVIVEADKIQLWQVYADTKIPFDIISRNQRD
jgi:ketosteroid isomerase-like protein